MLMILLSYYSNNYSDGKDWWVVGIIFGSLLLLAFLGHAMEYCDNHDVKGNISRFFIKLLKGRIRLFHKNYHKDRFNNIKIPIGLQHILYGFGLDYSFPTKIKYVDLMIKKRKRIIDTDFSFLIKTTYGKKFHLYFMMDDNDKEKWFFYKRGCFDNKPVRIKENYYSIMRLINEKTFENIKNNFKTRFDETIKLSKPEKVENKSSDILDLEKNISKLRQRIKQSELTTT